MGYWLVPLSGCCDGPLLAVKIGSGEDGGWFPTGRRGGTNASCTIVTEFWVLILVACDGVSDDDSVSNADNTGGVMVSSEGGGAVFVVIAVGPVNTTVLGTASITACVEIGRGGLLLFWWW